MIHYARAWDHGGRSTNVIAAVILHTVTSLPAPSQLLQSQLLRRDKVDASRSDDPDHPVLIDGVKYGFGFPGPYSQMGADTWVMRRFAEETHRERFFVDIGANNGVALSNTKALEEHGWKGICIEPFPTDFGNRTCELVNKPVAPLADQDMDMIKCSKWGGVYNGAADVIIRGGRYDDKDIFNDKDCKNVTMKTAGINEILAAAPQVIDYVNLDIEGAEISVLNAFPFNKYCVRVWTVEATAYRDDMRKILSRRKCTFTEVDFDDWFTCPCTEDDV